MRLTELECVRLTRPLQGEDCYNGRHISVPAGESATVVSVFGDAYEVEFLLRDGRGCAYSAVLTAREEDVEPCAGSDGHFLPA